MSEISKEAFDMLVDMVKEQRNMIVTFQTNIRNEIKSNHTELSEIMRDTEQGIFAIKDGLEERIDNKIAALKKEKDSDIEKVHNRISNLKTEVDEIRNKPYTTFEKYKGIILIAIITGIVNAVIAYGAKIWALLTGGKVG